MVAGRSEGELERLTKLYAEMSEGELLKLAGDAHDLTEVARQALLAEIERRRLHVAIPDYPSEDGIEWLELVTIRKFRDLPEALLAKGALESAGVESFLADDNMVRMNWLMSDFIGGIRLQVKADDVRVANDLLNNSGEPTSLQD